MSLHVQQASNNEQIQSITRWLNGAMKLTWVPRKICRYISYQWHKPRVRMKSFPAGSCPLWRTVAKQGNNNIYTLSGSWSRECSRSGPGPEDTYEGARIDSGARTAGHLYLAQAAAGATVSSLLFLTYLYPSSFASCPAN